MKYFLYCLQHYADFNGRARRSEYWYYTLFNVLFYIAFSIVAAFLAAVANTPELTALVYIWVLATFIPSLAVSVRRLHDLGKSGWFLLIGFIPIVGGIILLVWECTDSQPGFNQYGPNPKGVGNDAFGNPYQG